MATFKQSMDNKLGFVLLGYLKAKDEGGGYSNNALYIIIPYKHRQLYMNIYIPTSWCYSYYETALANFFEIIPSSSVNTIIFNKHFPDTCVRDN